MRDHTSPDRFAFSSDPWELGLSGSMQRAFMAIAEIGRLFRLGPVYGMPPDDRRFPARSIQALCDRSLVAIRCDRYRHDYAVLTGLGRLLLKAGDQSFAREISEMNGQRAAILRRNHVQDER
jgi:hypothetical protein